MKGGQQKITVPPIDPRKDRDEDLLLFFEMRRREKDRTINLLHPVSDDFEPSSGNGNYPLFRIPSAKKGTGNDFLEVYSGKNDYDWLKTPPATPLFPSLDMEAAGQTQVIQKEIPVLQLVKFSRFSGKSGDASQDSKESKPDADTKSKHPNSSSGPETPTQKPRVSAKQLPTTKGISVSTEKTLNRSSNPSKTSASATISTKLSNPTGIRPNKNDTNVSKQKPTAAVPKAKSRGVSPLARSRFPALICGFSDETPPNLNTTVSDRSKSNSRARPTNVTVSERSNSNSRSRPMNATVSDRSSSTSRSRPTNSTVPDRLSSTSRIRPANAAASERSSSALRGRLGNVTADTKQDLGKQRRESGSSCVARGRRMEFGHDNKGKSVGGNGSLVVGSRMVEKVVNARKSGVAVAEEKELKMKYRVSGIESSGFGRMMSKSSLDMALRHMEIKRNPINSHYYSTLGVKSYAATSSNSSKSSSPRCAEEEEEIKNHESLKKV